MKSQNCCSRSLSLFRSKCNTLEAWPISNKLHMKIPISCYILDCALGFPCVSLFGTLGEHFVNILTWPPHFTCTFKSNILEDIVSKLTFICSFSWSCSCFGWFWLVKSQAWQSQLNFVGFDRQSIRNPWKCQLSKAFCGRNRTNLEKWRHEFFP